MRSMKIKIGKKTLTLTANFMASVRIASEIADPLFMGREMLRSTIFEEQGIPYKAGFAYSIENVTQLLIIAIEAGGTELTEEELQELIFEYGFINAQTTASEYLAMLVEPKSKEIMKAGVAKEKAKTSGK